MYATTQASDKKHGTDTFYRLFKTFADRFKSSNYDEGFLSGDPTLVTAAYGNFLGCLRDEIQWNKEVKEGGNPSN